MSARERNKERERSSFTIAFTADFSKVMSSPCLYRSERVFVWGLFFCLPLIISLFLFVCLSLSLSPRLFHGSMYHSLDYCKPLVSPARGMCKLIVTPCLAYKVGFHFSPNKYRWQASLWDMDEVCNYMDALLWTNKEFANKLALRIKLPQKLPGGVSNS